MCRDKESSSPSQARAGLALHRPPGLQGGLGQDEPRGWIWKNVVPQEGGCGRGARSGEEHGALLLVLGPHRSGVVEVLKAGGPLTDIQTYGKLNQLRSLVKNTKVLDHVCFHDSFEIFSFTVIITNFFA